MQLVNNDPGADGEVVRCLAAEVHRIERAGNTIDPTITPGKESIRHLARRLAFAPISSP